MKKVDFYAIIDKLTEVPRGTIKGNEFLSDLQMWDSLTVIAFIAAIDKNLGIVVSASKLIEAKTVGDLTKLVEGKLVD